MATANFSGAVWRKSSRSGQGNNDACVEVAFVGWHKSSRSGQGVNGNCVEVAFAEWHKSTHSGQGSNNACVEVAVNAEAVGVRDSKNPTAPHLTFPGDAWHHFLAHN
ncbi:DUF397 domain-containing protein [Actinokineospora sp.]|uniref:DUF397 domain-containing protein n=1 Tax=Actinokineospora sp. TaxID=1872133 RepID=UPI004037AD8D